MTTFKMQITGATGGLIHLNITGENHFIFSNSYNQSHDEPLDLDPGYYLVLVAASTPGSFTFNVEGYKKILPTVPQTFNNAKRSYDLDV
jgi:hypothetical protein